MIKDKKNKISSTTVIIAALTLLLIFQLIGIGIKYRNLQSELQITKKEVNALKIRNQELATHVEELENLEISTETMFRIAAEQYDIDFKLIYAIAKLETGNFKSRLWLECNNPGGIKAWPTGWKEFDTPFEGIMYMARLLKQGYIDKGLTTVEQIGAKYCPDPEDRWVPQVNNIIKGLED